MNEPSHTSIESAELKAREALSVDLQELERVSMNTYNSISATLMTVLPKPLGGVTEALQVAAALLLRAANDLRTASILALDGYSDHALTIVASLYEIAMTIAYVSDDNSVARAWIEYDDPTRPFMPIKELTDNALRKMGATEEDRKKSRSYLTYRQLCLAKHGNPLHQLNMAYAEEDGTVGLKNGPYVCEDTVRASTFAMEHANRLCLAATATFIRNFMPKEHRKILEKEIRDLADSCDRIADKAVARFGSEDPFPGKWRI